MVIVKLKKLKTYNTPVIKPDNQSLYSENEVVKHPIEME